MKSREHHVRFYGWPSLVLLGVLSFPIRCSADQPQEWAENWHFLVLGQVTSVQLLRDSNGMEFCQYDARVVCDYRGNIPPGVQIAITGPREFLRSHFVMTPLMARGAYFIMPLESDQNKSVFQYKLDYGDNPWTPIGVRLPATISEKEASDAKVALLKYGEISKSGQALTPAAIEDLRTKDNYFLWALGTSALSLNAGRDDVNALQTDLQCGAASVDKLVPEIDEPGGWAPRLRVMSLRQALWTAHCLDEVVPPSSRPATEAVHAGLMDYLNRSYGFEKSSVFQP